MRYYNPKHHITPGTYPEPDDNKILKIVNFDKLTYCDEPGRDCWGYIEYEKPLSEKQASAYGLVRDRALDFYQRYMATHGTAILRTFATAAEMNDWWEAQDTEGRYFCRLYDCEKHVDILGSDYMWLTQEERFCDDPQETAHDNKA